MIAHRNLKGFKMFVVKFFNEEKVFLCLSPYYFKTWNEANKNGQAGIRNTRYSFEIMMLTEGV